MRGRLIIVGIIALALCGVAQARTEHSAITPAALAQQTKSVFNRRLVFSHATIRIASVRCQQDTPTAFFCIGKEQTTGGVSIGTYSWNVTIDSSGTIHWHGNG